MTQHTPETPEVERSKQKRPREEEIAAAANLLRAEAAECRHYAKSHHNLAAEMPDHAEGSIKSAAQFEARAACLDKVAEWMTNA